MSDLPTAEVDLAARIDSDDIVRGLNNNDEAILGFIVAMLLQADSQELRERLAERLEHWDEDRTIGDAP